MPPNMRPLMRVARLQCAFPRTPQYLQRAFASGTGNLPASTPGESSTQAMPIGPYYESILYKPQPIPEVKPEEPPSSSQNAPVKESKPEEQPTTSSAKTPRKETKPEETPAPSQKAPRKKAASQKAKANSTSGTTTKTSNSTSSSSSPSSSSSSPSSKVFPTTTTTTTTTAQEKARLIFGSRLAGPGSAERADRLQAIRDRNNKSTLQSGVLVPPRPEEPDNCCMSGCVHCVWDAYRDDLETWAAASARAQALQETQRRKQKQKDVMMDVKPSSESAPVNVSLSMDDDGGGSETNWHTEEMVRKTTDGNVNKIAKDLWEDELYKNVPVGIREFMKQEKRLKEKQERAGTLGA